MKTMKLKKAHYVNLAKLLTDAGAVDLKKNVASPENVYCSKQDLKKMTAAITKAFKKEYPGLNPKEIQASVGMHMLNLSPNSSLGDVIKSGYVVIDEEAINLYLSGILIHG